MNNEVVKVHELNRTFHLNHKSSVRALNDVTLSIQKGTCLAVVGESGSGKSTLARVIVGLESADSGEVEIMGHRVKPTTKRRELKERAQLVQMVFQDPHGSLNRSLPAGTTVDEMLRIHHPELNRAHRKERVGELFEEVGLTERHTQALPDSLSGGQKQRVAIARALASPAKVIVLDEAVSALDVSVQAQVLELLKRLRDEHGLTYLFITHDLSVVREIADEVLVMRRGAIVETGTVGEVLDHPQHPYTQLLIASAPRPGWKPQRATRERNAR